MRQVMARKRPTTGRELVRRGKTAAATTRKLPTNLIDDLRRMIDESRQAVAQTVNTALVWLYWNIGTRIREDVLEAAL